MEWAAKGDAAAAKSDHLQAVYCYTQALIEHPQAPDYFTKRAAAFTRLKPQRNDLALRDAEYAVLLGQKRAKREKIQAGQQRRVVALYGLGQYENAKYLLGTMKKWRKTGDAGRADQMEHDMWMAKINTRLKGKEETAHAVGEYPDIDLPNEKELKTWLQSQINKDGTFRLEDSKSTISETTEKADKVAEQPVKEESITQKEKPTKPAAQPIRNDFFQNNDNLIVTFYAKKVDPSKFTCSIETNSVQISFPHPDDQSSTFTYSVPQTFAELDTGKSTSKVFGTKVELTLAKAEKGVKWPALEAKDKPTMTTLPSPYVSKQNSDWEKKAAELTKKEPKKDKKKKGGDDENDDGNDSDADSEFGGDPVDGFFKKLYAGADEDTRRAMMKSFQESNGTALSTNWSEVSKGHVDEVKSKDDK